MYRKRKQGRGWGDIGEGHCVEDIRGGHTDKVTVDQRPAAGEVVSTWLSHGGGRRNPSGRVLVYSRNSKEARVAGANQERGEARS